MAILRHRQEKLNGKRKERREKNEMRKINSNSKKKGNRI